MRLRTAGNGRRVVADKQVIASLETILMINTHRQKKEK